VAPLLEARRPGLVSAAPAVSTPAPAVQRAVESRAATSPGILHAAPTGGKACTARVPRRQRPVWDRYKLSRSDIRCNAGDASMLASASASSAPGHSVQHNSQLIITVIITNSNITATFNRLLTTTEKNHKRTGVKDARNVQDDTKTPPPPPPPNSNKVAPSEWMHVPCCCRAMRTYLAPQLMCCYAKSPCSVARCCQGGPCAAPPAAELQR
jgi:hypothetical protein